MEELDATVRKTLKDNVDEEACTSDVKVARRKWLEQSKNITRFRSDLSSMVIALSTSVADADDEALMVLLAAGAVSAQDGYGAEPLHNLTFCPRYRPETIKALLLHNADVESRDYAGRTPLSWLAGSSKSAASDNAAML